MIDMVAGLELFGDSAVELVYVGVTIAIGAYIVYAIGTSGAFPENSVASLLLTSLLTALGTFGSFFVIIVIVIVAVVILSLVALLRHPAPSGM